MSKKLQTRSWEATKLSTEDALNLLVTQYIREKYGHRMPPERPSNAEILLLAKDVAADLGRIATRAVETIVHANVRQGKGH